MSEEKKKIFIVDDDEYLLEMYALKFEEEGFVVGTAREGTEAVQKIKEMDPDVVLLDIVLPGMDGFEILKKVREEKLAPNAKILMLTNLGQKDDTERGIALGADEYIVKAHFTPSEIAKKVKDVISK